MSVAPKQNCLYLIFAFVLISWFSFTAYNLSGRSVPSLAVTDLYLKRLDALEKELHDSSKLHEEVLAALKSEQRIALRELLGKDVAAKLGSIDKPENVDAKLEAAKDELIDGSFVIPVLLLACNRPTVEKAITQLLALRPSAAQFPLVVSQDCRHAETRRVINKFKSHLTLIEQPDQSDISVPPKAKKFLGYYKIARHYKWALDQIFGKRNHSAVIIVEDDLEFAKDFFEYFAATLPILRSDPTLWCVSAWNDNGKEGLIDAGGDELLYRTDFFPGLGWMMLRSLWVDELSPKWPETFWDDWMRNPDQRRGRACIRPEVPRTSTFGRIGVSKGQFFDKHLKYIKHSAGNVPFRQRDLSYLVQAPYDAAWVKTVYDSPVVSVDSIVAKTLSVKGSVRVTYATKDEYKSIAKRLRLMDDLKSGVPRTGYRGVVSILVDKRRVYIAPPPTWTRYDLTWN